MEVKFMENFGYPLEELVAIVAELTPKYVGYEHSSITFEKAQMLDRKSVV